MTSFRRKKTKSNCLANLPRLISQTSSLFRQSQHKRKIGDKNKRYCRQNKCSDLTCTKKYALTEGPKREGELMWATRSAPPVILCLLRACSIASPCKIVTKVRLHFRRSHISQTAAGNWARGDNKVLYGEAPPRGPTLLIACELTSEIPTLLYIWRVKKVPLSGGASPYRPL